MLTARRRLRRLRRMPLLSPRLWMRRLVFWVGAVLVAAVSVAFAAAADRAQDVFQFLSAGRPYVPFVLAPAVLAVSVLLTRTVFPGAQGSGIPQVIAALHMTDKARIAGMLSPRIAVGKVLLTLLGLAGGASIGREGPTVQVSAVIMHALGNALHLPRRELQHALVLAGGAAGIAAAFNTPLAGVVFAIEELSHSFEARTSGTVLTAVIVAGIATTALVGNYTYFGVSDVGLPFGVSWSAVLLCAAVCGLAGGVFSQALITAAGGLPRRLGAAITAHPVIFAGFCGLGIAVLGYVSDGATYGTGYAQAQALVKGSAHLPGAFAIAKLLATVLSYISGIPGGIFAPSLAIGAALGNLLAPLVPHAPAGAIVLLGMVGYFSGVVQAPITATLIVLEMTANQRMTIPLLATSMVAFGFSRLICRRALYGALARRFLLAVHTVGIEEAATLQPLEAEKESED